MLCQNETDLKLIQEIMGHADISTTMNVYNESNAERKKASFSRIESTTDFTTGRRRVMLHYVGLRDVKAWDCVIFARINTIIEIVVFRNKFPNS